MKCNVNSDIIGVYSYHSAPLNAFSESRESQITLIISKWDICVVIIAMIEIFVILIDTDHDEKNKVINIDNDCNC